MQCGSANSPGFAIWEMAADSAAIIAELDTAKYSTLLASNRNPDSVQSLNRIGHQTFATRLVHRRVLPLENDERGVLASQPRSPPRAPPDPRRSPPHHIGLACVFVPPVLTAHHCSRTSSEQKPGPIAARTL